jgi:hypothetical protein
MVAFTLSRLQRVAPDGWFEEYSTRGWTGGMAGGEDVVWDGGLGDWSGGMAGGEDVVWDRCGKEG